MVDNQQTLQQPVVQQSVTSEQMQSVASVTPVQPVPQIQTQPVIQTVSQPMQQSVSPVQPQQPVVSAPVQDIHNDNPVANTQIPSETDIVAPLP